MANGELHGIEGAFPLNGEFVRWINEFVVAGCDHEGADASELSYKTKDFILVRCVAIVAGLRSCL